MNKVLRYIKKYPKQADIIILIFGFSLGANLFIFFKTSGLSETYTTEILERFGFHWTIPTLAGVVIGTSFALLEYRLFMRMHHRNRTSAVLTKAIVFSAVIVLASILIQTFVAIAFHGQGLRSSLENALSFLYTDIFLSLYIYLVLLGATLNFFRTLGNKFGHGIILNYILGRYRAPVEEHRVFIFLDLNNSTGMAEKLGHIKYSRLINKCFNDLSTVVSKYGADIYQFVGDEVVLTWKITELPEKVVAFRFLQDFYELLEQSKSFYTEKFNVTPTFKASVHAGAVSVVEVGGRRKDLAYHGDVLNTGARLLELCKKYGQNIITTENFLTIAGPLKTFSSHYLTTLQLRGKKKKVSIFGIKALKV